MAFSENLNYEISRMNSLKLWQNYKAQNFLAATKRFSFSHLPAVKKDTIFGETRKIFCPSYFVTALGSYLIFIGNIQVFHCCQNKRFIDLRNSYCVDTVVCRDIPSLGFSNVDYNLYPMFHPHLCWQGIVRSVQQYM